MERKGINLENVKLNNRSAILRLLNDQGAMSRKDIAVSLGLTPATVTVICNELLAAGALSELGELQENRRAGRKKILLGINYNFRYVLCVSVEADSTCLTVSNLQGEALAGRSIRTETEVEPEVFLKHVADESRVLMWEHNIPRDQVLGVGVSLPGSVDRRQGLSRYAYRVWDTPVEVGACLNRLLKYPVIIENNVKAYAEAGLAYEKELEKENILFLKWGPGVGCAIVIHNKVYEGIHTKAAEIGHVVVEPGGKKCRCGRRGCLETVASTHAVAELVRDACVAGKTPELYRYVEGDPGQIQAGNISWWVRCRDDAMWRLLDGVIGQLVQVACAAMTMIAPDKMILYGQMFELPEFQERFLRGCGEYDPSYDGRIIIPSRLKDKIDFIGPLAVVVNELFLSGRAVGESGKAQED